MQFIDLHCDTILRLMDGGCLRENTYGVDIAKLRRGDALAQFFALFIDQQQVEDPLNVCLKMLDRFYEELKENQADIALATNEAELQKNRQVGKISAFLTIEEGGALRGEMANLRNFYRLGVRLVTLTWNYPNEIGYPNTHGSNVQGTYQNQGLTSFGRDVVAEMNRLDMLIDVSHLSDGGFFDVARLSQKPFVASHSNARAITGHYRNLTDEMIRLLADKGGVMGINFARNFLGSPDISRVEDMIRHIRHIYRIGGIDVLAIGSDLDGIEPELEIDNSGDMDKLRQGLEQNGFTADDIEKIFYRNTLRVIHDTLR